MKYYWVRVFDYNLEMHEYDQGTLLDEFYLKGEELTREEAKEQVKQKYNGDTSENIKFAKPRKKDGLYAIVMDSNKFFYDRFYLEIDTYCFCCHKHIKGKVSDFPKMNLDNNSFETDLESDKTAYFCEYDCKHKMINNMRYEGEFQEKEAISNEVFGYIYHMYNKSENKHYVGQTRFLPFFRWQEHIKAGGKGNITDISFDVITEIKRISYVDEENQKYLNNIEAWWIQKYIQEGFEVFNVTIPKLTIEDYQKKFDEMVSQKRQLELI
ncbi:hypothetical protein [Clostridium beijerinckii]|uniref:hypothetical protein n=1 Tax=Clostridium beijerinckii TaxID=1520 RepID=UPI001F338454|nr:hypothetical protein [Clostridium beijerinckii]